MLNILLPRKVLWKPDSYTSYKEIHWSTACFAIQVRLSLTSLALLNLLIRTDGSVASGGFRAVARFTYGPEQGFQVVWCFIFTNWIKDVADL